MPRCNECFYGEFYWEPEIEEECCYCHRFEEIVDIKSAEADLPCDGYEQDSNDDTTA